MASPEGRLYMSVDDGYLYAIDLERESAELACRIPRVPSRGNYYFLDENRVVFAGHSQYYGLCDIRTGELDLHRTEIENPPIGIFSILPTSTGDIYCSAHLGLSLSRVNPTSGRAEVLGLTYNGSGEIYGSAEAGGNIYSIAYTHNVLTVYDPDRPWRPGPAEGDNPRNLGPMGDEQYRPVTGILNGPRNRLYIGSMPDYGARGGALTVVNPSDNSHKSYRHLVPDHSILGLAAGPEHVYLGTSIIADGYIHPAEGNACFLIFDPGSETVLYRGGNRGRPQPHYHGYGAGRVLFLDRRPCGRQPFSRLPSFRPRGQRRQHPVRQRKAPQPAHDYGHGRRPLLHPRKPDRSRQSINRIALCRPHHGRWRFADSGRHRQR